MLRAHWKSLVPFLLTVWAVQFYSASITLPQVQGWYTTLAKPAWNPPNFVFGPVWSLLYLLIAIAGWRVWARLRAMRKDAWRHPALRVWALQMILNLAWSCLFFGMQRIELALVDLCALLLAIALFIHHAKPVDRISAWLFAPYLLWVAYATSLNTAILALN